MNPLSKLAALLAAALLVSAPAVVHAKKNPGNPTGGKFAEKHPRRNQVNNRVKNQRGRIAADEKSGKITKSQANQLRANDRAIKKQEHAEVKANGGHLTKGEQKQLNREENANSKMIHDEAHPAGQ